MVEREMNNDEAAVPDDVAVGIPPAAPQPAGNNGELHPVMRIMQEKELGKAVMALSVAIAMGIIVSVGKDKDAQPKMSSLILLVLCVCIPAILNGILLKETFPDYAQIAEALGISLAVTGFFLVVAVFLPASVSWVPAVCIAGCLWPFGIALWQRRPNN